MIIILRDSRDEGQEDQPMIGSWSQIMEECSYCSEETAMAMTVGNDQSVHELGAERK